MEITKRCQLSVACIRPGTLFNFSYHSNLLNPGEEAFEAPKLNAKIKLHPVQARQSFCLVMHFGLGIGLAH